MARKAIAKEEMQHFNMADFLRGKASQLLTALSKDDTTAYIQKHGKPIAVVLSYERYKRMREKGFDFNDYRETEGKQS
jgi:prevent-host-death family protein